MANISFSGINPRLIIDGAKIESRRPIKIPKRLRDQGMTTLKKAGVYPAAHILFVPKALGESAAIHCPYGGPGTELWVKETYLSDSFGFHSYWASYKPEEKIYIHYGDLGQQVIQRMKGDDLEPFYGDFPVNVDILYGLEHGQYHKKPARCMPRKYSRLTIRLKDVRAELLQDIDVEGFKAEGISPITEGFRAEGFHIQKVKEYMEYAAPFRDIWNKMWKGTEYVWGLNPWVWVLMFELISFRRA